ncbi:unnamed protein product [Ascophyllum nodosum]
MLIEERNRAEAVRAKADAEAILAREEAEAKVLEMRGDAFAHFGNAAVVQSIVEKLPDIAREVAAPPSRTKKMVFVSGDCGGAGSHLNEDVGTISSQLPVTVEGSTRVDITKRLDHDLGDGSTTSPAQTVHDPIKI